MRGSTSRYVCYPALALIPIALGVAYGGQPSIVDSPHDFGPVRYGRVVSHRFTIRNRSILPVEIGAVTPACECTHAKLESKRIRPFGNTHLDVTFDTKGFHGQTTRFIDIELSKPRKRNVLVTFDIDVRGAPDKGLEKILFSQPCAKCHVAPGVGKKGKELFDAVCLMCHTSGKAATPISNGEWGQSQTDITRNGLPGTSMPGYSKAHGGKLTEEQIRSIEKHFSSH